MQLRRLPPNVWPQVVRSGGWNLGQKILVNSVNMKHYFRPENNVYSVAPIMCWWTLVPPFSAVHIVHYMGFSRGGGMYICTYYLHVSNASPAFNPIKGTRTVPLFYPSLRGFLLLRLGLKAPICTNCT